MSRTRFLLTGDSATEAAKERRSAATAAWKEAGLAVREGQFGRGGEWEDRVNEKDEEENHEEQEEQLIRKDAMKNVNLLEYNLIRVEIKVG